MFEKIREKRHIGRFVKKDLSLLFTEIEDIRRRSDIIAICPTPTGSNWQGVMHATFNLFPESTFMIPQYYSNPVYSENELLKFSNRMEALNFKMVVFSGFISYLSNIISNLRSTKIGIIFHGALSELSNENNQLQFILDLASSGKIHHIGFIKKGLSEYFNNTYAGKCFDLLLKTRLPEGLESRIPEKGINIGVFGHSGFNKNIHNQVAASLLIKGARVHVICDLDFSYLDKNKRIIKHSKLDRNKFLELLWSMTLNSHISFSESWGQIVTESLALGVPCLTSNNNGIFDHDEYLAEKLIVNQYDNPLAISDQIKMVIENSNNISKRGIAYVNKLNDIADMKIREFINA